MSLSISLGIVTVLGLIAAIVALRLYRRGSDGRGGSNPLLSLASQPVTYQIGGRTFYRGQPVFYRVSGGKVRFAEFRSAPSDSSGRAYLRQKGRKETIVVRRQASRLEPLTN